MDMSAAGEILRWSPSQPRVAAGAAGGGQFAPASGGSGAAAKGKDTRAAPSNAHPVGEGEHGKRVSDLQARLNALGFKPPLKVDGIFGPKTLAAVRAFQKSHGLKVDGLVGPKTTAALRTKHAAARHPASKPAHHVTAKPAQPAAKPVSPAVRPPAVVPAKASRALAHEKVGHTGQGLWHGKNRQLPAYIQHIANDLIQGRGMPESEAIATAVAQCKRWAAGGPDVKPETQAKAQAAVAEWERLRAGTHARRTTTVSSGYDEDGLDGSWDGDLGEVPDLTGLTVADFEALSGDTGDPGASRMAKVGSGARFKALKAKLAAKGASDPGALAAYIGRKKYGKAKFASLAGKARKGKGGSMHRSELMRIYPLEDIHILTRAEGDGSGRVVEAYATVFDQEAEIHDGQGHYREVIDRSAFDQVLQRIAGMPGGLAANVKVLYNHGKTIGGAEAPEFQLPLGKPLDVRPEARGLLTRTEYDASDPFTERILSKIHAGTITAQSFVGGIIRSTPELKGPGDRYRGRNGTLTKVRRMVLGLREYGPVLFPAYTGAEILGVRMSIPGAVLDDEIDEATPDTAEVEEFASGMEDGDAGGIPEEVHPTRDHAHRLLVTRTEQMLREAGIAPLDRGW